MARWKAEQTRDYLDDYYGLTSDIDRAGTQQGKKSTAAKYGAMIGAVTLPLAVALSPFTAGQSLTMWSIAGLAGVGSAVGGFAGSKAYGKDIDVDRGDRTFLRDEALEAQSIIDKAKSERTEDIWKQAGLDAATAGFWKGGGADLLKDLGAKGAKKALGPESAQTMFQNLGFIGTETPKADFAKLLKGEKTADFMKGINPLKKESWITGTSQYPGHLGDYPGLDKWGELMDLPQVQAARGGGEYKKLSTSMYEGLKDGTLSKKVKGLGESVTPSIDKGASAFDFDEMAGKLNKDPNVWDKFTGPEQEFYRKAHGEWKASLPQGTFDKMAEELSLKHSYRGVFDEETKRTIWGGYSQEKRDFYESMYGELGYKE